jgi:hypothetical protein
MITDKRVFMHTERRFSRLAVLVSMSAAVCAGQSITSARSGTLHYFQGDVSIDGAQIQPKASVFPQIKDQGVLSTARGRAEILLTPGVFLRVGENSSIRMLDTRLTSTRVDILSGSVIVESDDPQMTIKDSPVTLLYKDYELHMGKHGLFEVTSDPAQMKVFKGEVEVSTSGNRVVVKEDHLMPFAAGLTTEKFDPKSGDELYIWARERSENLSAANMSSARSISTGSCFVACTNGGGAWNGGWYYNPYFDMITYVPMAGTFWSPFGYGFFSPVTIGQYYSPVNTLSNRGIGSTTGLGTNSSGVGNSGSTGTGGGSTAGLGGGSIGGGARGSGGVGGGTARGR